MGAWSTDDRRHCLRQLLVPIAYISCAEACVAWHVGLPISLLKLRLLREKRRSPKSGLVSAEIRSRGQLKYGQRRDCRV